MFIAPKRNRNSFCWIFSPKISFPIKAACPAPNPGRNAVNGAESVDAKVVFAKDFFVNLIFLNGKIFCKGIFVFCLMLMNRLLAPKSPVNKGRRGSLIFRFKDAIPKKPASKKIIRAHNLFCFSV